MAEGTVVRFDDVPEIAKGWADYVSVRWLSWAEEDRRLQKALQIYTELFSIYQKQQKLGEEFEVVVGLGLLTWLTPGRQNVRRHIVTARTNMTFDPLRATISIGPAGEGARPVFEQDMLEPNERPAPQEQNRVDAQLLEVGDDLWEGVRVQEALRSWVQALSPRGIFQNTLSHQAVADADPRVVFAPAVILRKRTERTLARLLGEIAEQLREGREIPEGVVRLVSEDEGPTQSPEIRETTPASSALGACSETYFPLPANQEQADILQKLQMQQGVLVQGPPGTGKSHTIANLVCHLLAQGQRVLVTSHTARALRVLQAKVPQSLASLCVSLLGDDQTALKSLEDSVHGITDKYARWDINASRTTINRLTKNLDDARRSEATSLTRIRAIREAETYVHAAQFGGYAGTAKAIGARLREEEPRLGWVPAIAEGEPEVPVTDAEAQELLTLLRAISPEEESECGLFVPALDVIPNPTEVSRLVEIEKTTRAQYESTADKRNDRRYLTLSQMPTSDQRELVGLLAEFVSKFKALQADSETWVVRSVAEVLTGRAQQWKELLDASDRELRGIKHRHQAASRLQVSGLENRDPTVVRAHALSLIEHLDRGGGLGVGPFRRKAVKDALYLVREVRLDGRPCDNGTPLRLLTNWLDVVIPLDSLRRDWAGIAVVTATPPSQQYGQFYSLVDKLREVMWLSDAKAKAAAMLTRVSAEQPAWTEIDSVQQVAEVLRAALLEDELRATQKVLFECEVTILPHTRHDSAHPRLTGLLKALRARDVAGYLANYNYLEQLIGSRSRLARRQKLRDLLDEGSPDLARKLEESFHDTTWDSRIQALSKAWNWALANKWFGSLCDPREYERLVSALDVERSRIQKETELLAAERAWGACFERMSERQRQNLIAWAKEMRKIGKGTGKHAEMHRRVARLHMEECRSAIPAWVMPLYRVAESARPGKDLFDVVIVDEASQSGPEALFLQYIARKIVVVGDDKQIKPDNVGMDRSAVDLLRQRHIADLPLTNQFDLENSFFDHAEIRYGGRIRLREHFRCMPEIIQFSNDLCYRSEPLIPLKQFGAGRLSPVVITRHVESGYLSGPASRTQNVPEAEAVCEAIRRCCQDKLYDGKSFGVIGLLGDQQPRAIESLLLASIGPEEMERRSLVCGDAYAFQGDERDVMFLSLVSAPTEGRRIGVLASQRDERRFNVAVSRAKDQLWLFHSATLNDLSPNCLRYRLLQYCQNPKVAQSPIAGMSASDLEYLARSADRKRTRPPDPFDSWFEVDVFTKIAGRGYRVIPQYEIAGYYIDLLVEGLQGRLAVECDGDACHGVEQFAADMARQRMLERCGTSFWRVRESAFYRDPTTALVGLWETLNRHQIHPSLESTN